MQTGPQVTDLYAAARAEGAVLRILPAGAGHAQSTLYTAIGKPSRFRREVLEFVTEQTHSRGGVS